MFKAPVDWNVGKVDYSPFLRGVSQAAEYMNRSLGESRSKIQHIDGQSIGRAASAVMQSIESANRIKAEADETANAMISTGQLSPERAAQMSPVQILAARDANVQKIGMIDALQRQQAFAVQQQQTQAQGQMASNLITNLLNKKNADPSSLSPAENAAIDVTMATDNPVIGMQTYSVGKKAELEKQISRETQGVISEKIYKAANTGDTTGLSEQEKYQVAELSKKVQKDNFDKQMVLYANNEEASLNKLRPLVEKYGSVENAILGDPRAAAEIPQLLETATLGWAKRLDPSGVVREPDREAFKKNIIQTGRTIPTSVTLAGIDSELENIQRFKASNQSIFGSQNSQQSNQYPGFTKQVVNGQEYWINDSDPNDIRKSVK